MTAMSWTPLKTAAMKWAWTPAVAAKDATGRSAKLAVGLMDDAALGCSVFQTILMLESKEPVTVSCPCGIAA